MTTLLVWLLISVGSERGQAAQPSALIERFANVTECQRVLEAIREVRADSGKPALRCIQATILVPKN